MTLTNFGARLMASLKTKERRTNRGADVSLSRHAINNARMHRTLVEISNKTRTQMDDAEFRDWAQDLAHAVIEDIGRIK